MAIVDSGDPAIWHMEEEEDRQKKGAFIGKVHEVLDPILFYSR